MAKDQRTIGIEVDIQATLKGMDDVVAKLQKGLKEGSTQIDLSKGIGKSLQKQIDSFQEYSRKFAQLTKDNQINFGDAKEAQKTGSEMIKIFQTLQATIGDFNDLSVLDAKKLFPQAFNTKVDEARTRLESIRSDLEKLDNTQIKIDAKTGELEDLKKKLEELQAKLDERKVLKTDVSTTQEALNTVNKTIDELRAKLRESISVKIKVAEGDKESLESKVREAIQARKDLGVSEQDFSGSGKTLAYKGHKESTWRKQEDSEEKTAALQAIEAYKQEMAVIEQLKQKTVELEKLRKEFANNDLVKAASNTGASVDEMTAITGALERQKQATEENDRASQKLAAHQKEHGEVATQIEKTTKAIQKQESDIIELRGEYDKLDKEIDTNGLIELLKNLGIEKISGLDITPELLKNEEGLKRMLSSLSAMDKAKLDILKASLRGIGLSADQAEEAIKTMNQVLGQTDDSVRSIKDADKEIEQLTNNLKQFFSLGNSIQLFKRAITSAMNTVKELDATMTEAAVVTDFSVGDMWDKLPTYSAEAQELGVSINGMYQATTLYYQQGLKTNEAMALGIETMKMARIAGMESAEATEAMTAALRGFNMELNETSATQVNDVYSKLAAVTAADTNQIATAMSKTASIAASANMEFETTAALLAQIIETTQEAPETAGTAMKTIIARFSEVKTLASSGQKTGKDTEGEEIDVNKIQTALRSVGISMTDFFNGTEGLDSVLLKLAEKWNELDFSTQRYIATTAAGSRQQSRFIAMMSDYARTTELVGAAQNSAGASQMQFNKTLDSMETKLQQLENTWNEFLMGLANSEILKTGVDFLTNLLSGINNIINAMSFGVGPLKSIISLLLTISTLKIGKGIFQGFMDQLKNTKTQIQKTGNLAQTAVGDKPEIEGEKAGEKTGNGFINKLLSIFRSRKSEVQAEKDQLLADNTTNPTASSTTPNPPSNPATSPNSVSPLNKNMQEGTEGLEKNAASANKLGKAYDYVNKNSAILATSFMSVAMACSALSQRFEETGNTGLAKTFSGIATGASYLGTALMVLPGILQGLKIAADLASKGFVKLYAAMGPIGLIIIGLVAAALILVGVIASLETESEILSARLETIAERMNHFSEESQKAKEAVDELTQALEDMKTKDPFEGLIKGTKAWNEALIENNRQVLDLINKYPELSQYLKNDQGRLYIEEEGLTQVIERQQRDAENATYAAETLVQEQIKTNRTLALNETSSLKSSEDRYRTFGINDVKYADLITQLMDQGVFDIKDEEAREELIASILQKNDIDDEKGFKADTIYTELFGKPNDTDADREKRYTSWANFVQDNRIWKDQQEGSSTGVIGGIVASTAGSSQYAGILNEAMGTLYADSFGWNFESELEDVLQDFDFDGKSTEWYNKYAKQKGIKVSDIDRLKKEEGLTDEDIVRTVMIEEKRQEIETTTKDFEKFLGNNKDIAKWFSWENLTKTDLASMGQNFPNELWRTYAEELTNMGWSKDSFVKHIQSQIDSATDALSKTTNENISAKEYSLRERKIGFYGNEAIMGNEGIEQLSNLVTGALSEEQKNIFTTSMYDIDWSNEEEINAFKKQMEDLGYNLPIQEFDNLINKLKEVGNASKKLSLEEVKEITKTASKLLGELRSGEHEGVFSKEDYETMIKMDPDLAQAFVETEDGFILVDLTMEDLIATIDENTKALNQKTIDQLNAKAKAVEVINTIDPQKQGKDFLSEFIAGMTENQLKGLNIEGLSKQTDLGAMSNADANALAKKVLQIVEEGNAQYYLDQANQLQKSSAIQAAESGSLTTWDIMSFGRGESPTGGKVESSSGSNPVLAMATTSGTGEFFDENLMPQGPSSTLTTNTNLKGLGKPVVFGSTQSGEVGGEQKKWTDKEHSSAIVTAKELGVAQKVIDDYITARNSANEADDFAAQTALKNAIAQASANKVYKTTLTNLKKLGKEYEKVNENSPEYEEVVQDYSETLGFDEAFVKENFGLVQEAAAGDIEALQQLYDLANQKYEIQVEANGDFTLLRDEFGRLQEGVQEYLAEQQKLGNVELVEITTTTAGTYPVWNGTEFVDQPLKANMTYTTLRMKTADEIETISKDAGYSSRSSGGSKPKEWENPYDEFYNSIEKINEELRIREQLERRYQRLLDRNTASAAELARIQRDQLTSLEAERKEREYILEGRKRQMTEILQENSDVGQYATWNEQEMRIEIDWDLLEQLKGSTDTELTDKVQDFISALEEQQKLLEEELDAIESIEDATWEIFDTGKDEYVDLENQIKDALVESRQREIDELSEINNSINDANSAILDSMQKQIDEERQLRDNQKTEEEIADKEARLAYLRQDTSGANALEIMKLEKEITDQKQDYTDTLIDQKISELQEQNDLAAEQRQSQIDILQAQLDWYSSSAQIWNEVHNLMEEGLDKTNGLVRGSDLFDLLTTSEGFEGMSNIQQMVWMDDTNDLIAKALSWLSAGAMQSLYGQGTEVTFTNKDGKEITGTVDGQGNVVTSDGKIYDRSSFSMDYTSKKLTSSMGEKDFEKSETSPPEEPEIPELTENDKWGIGAAIRYGSGGWGNGSARIARLKEIFGENDIQANYVWDDVSKYNGKYTGTRADYSYENMKKKYLLQYKTGGLADFTGPAWLDGTKSRPEYILNAEQTKAFFNLVDVLGSLQSGNSKTAQNSGDNTYDIDINVESIGSDYDVEQLANTVKRLINEDARYRNNNAINLMR